MSHTPPPSRPRARLVHYDLRLSRGGDRDPSQSTCATVDCQQRGCSVAIEDCTRCPRFARIDVHEAGYTVCCRAEQRDEAQPEADSLEGEGQD